MTRRAALILVGLLPAVATAYPSTDRGALEGGAGLSDLAVSSDGRYVAAAQRSTDAGLAIWDRIAPSEVPTLAEVCEASSVVWTTHATRGEAFYVGCGTNAVVRVELDDSTVPPTASVGAAIEVGSDGDSVVALAWTSGDTVLHAMTSGSSNVALHSIGLADDVVDGFTGLPATVAGTGIDLVVEPVSGIGNVIGIQSDGALLWASRSGVYSGSESAVITGSPVGLALDPDGISDLFLAALSNGEVWAGDVDAPSAFPTLFVDGLSSPQAIALGPGDSAPVVYIANASRQLRVFDLSANELELIERCGTGAPVAIVPAPSDSDTVYIASGDGTVRVATERPWVTDLAIEPRSVGEGEDFTVTFTVDSDHAWDLRVGSGISRTAGTSLAAGTASADEEVTVTLSAGDLPSEGANRVVLFATSAGATGIDSETVTLDTPPDAVTGFAVEPGDGRIVATWTSTSEEDIASYRIYLSDAAFTATDDDLPELTVTTDDGEVDYPREIAAGDPSSGQSVEVLGLGNGATYWIAVQPIDESGNEGPLTAVLSAAPQQSCGLVECYGDTGCTCASQAAEPSWFALALLGLGLLGVRRRP